MATIEIDGKKIEAESGKMVIEVADEQGISIPRFCYHKKLSVAANCRMCLVEVEKAPKPLPACATPVTDGMKVFTKSEKARIAQKAVMEFILINHPLDCPICDQGGECELQDVSMGYGQDVSQFTEGKRAVSDDDLGSLISTEMTRCIHCTRCVRFGEEVAGIRELGATGRGEHTKIGTYVKHAMDSEVSGNIIDLCPVGALTSKPYRFTARPWELTQYKSVSPHDCLGSNLNVHVRRNDVMRVLPDENEAINETWLSDRDRFAYTGLNNSARLQKPMVKDDGVWREVSWDIALEKTVKGLKRVLEKHGSNEIAALSSSIATTEEAFLLQKLMRGIGVNNLDYRLHDCDFSDDACLPHSPHSDAKLADIDNAEHLLLFGSDLLREQPLAALRVRKAQLAGAKIGVINPRGIELNCDITEQDIVSPAVMVEHLVAVVCSLTSGKSLDEAELRFLASYQSEALAGRFFESLKDSKHLVIIVGAAAQNHPQASTIRSLLALLQKHTDVKLLTMTEGPNAAGCAQAGLLPHRKAFAELVSDTGFNVRQALEKKLKAYVLLHAEPEFDFANPFLARQSLLGAEFVVMMTPTQSDNMLDYADVLLPVGSFAETSGTYVNCQGEWQTFRGLVAPAGEARPAWKVLRVLGNLFDVLGFEYETTEDIKSELDTLQAISEGCQVEWFEPTSRVTADEKSLVRYGQWPLYRVDSLCRQSGPLQSCSANDVCEVRMHPDTIKSQSLGENVTISQGQIEITLPLISDEQVAKGVVSVANAWPETADLGDAFAAIKVK
jgi:NADH-quinone oxidoreductase subunit G